MIAYYAHQHGSGHSNYAQLFALQEPTRFIIFTSYPFSFQPELNVVMLPDENPDGTQAPANRVALPDYLHYSPVGQRSIQHRSVYLLQKCLEHQVKLVIIDVSVEVAALARAASFPYAYVRLPGERNDTPHIQAFQGAVFLLAYYPKAMESPLVSEWIQAKTRYLGFFSRFAVVKAFKRPTEIKNVVILSGNGGNAALKDILPEVLARFDQAQIDIFGELHPLTPTCKARWHGYKQDLSTYISAADVVVSGCGLNTISELLHFKKLVLAVPEERPYGEQYTFYEQLIQHQLVASLEWALQADDQQILNSTIDPSEYLYPTEPSRFVEQLVNTTHPWDLL